MESTKIPGTIGFHKTLESENLKGDKMKMRIRAATDAARLEAITMASIHRGRRYRLHVIVTAEPLRDSAGSPLCTRDACG